MSSCGDDISVFEWAGDNTSSNETRDVSHINNEVSTNKICDLAHAGVIDQAAVGRCSSNEDFGSVHEGILLQLIVVDNASLEVNAVWEGFEVGRDSRDP